MTRYREYHLSGEARVTGNATSPGEPSDVIGGEFDFGLFSSSWDPRCLCVTRADLAVNTSALLLFENRGMTSHRDEHDPALSEFLTNASRKVMTIQGRSEDLNSIWGSIRESLVGTQEAVGQPLRVFIDLSACPRYYALATLALSVRGGFANSVTISYSEGNYEERDLQATQELFTIGKWETVGIPFLEGSYDPEKKRFLLSSVGFEGEKTYRAVTSFDPDKIAILFPDPGTRPDYPERTWKENYDILEGEYDVPEDLVVRAPAGDAISA